MAALVAVLNAEPSVIGCIEYHHIPLNARAFRARTFAARPQLMHIAAVCFAPQDLTLDHIISPGRVGVIRRGRTW